MEHVEALISIYSLPISLFAVVSLYDLGKQKRSIYLTN